MSEGLTKEDRQEGMLYTAALSLFAAGGILAAVFFPPGGLALLGPLLLGPGITILLLGITYDWSIGPAMGITSEGLGEKIQYAYVALGVLFCIMGFFLWILG